MIAQGHKSRATHNDAAPVDLDALDQDERWLYDRIAPIFQMAHQIDEADLIDQLQTTLLEAMPQLARQKIQASVEVDDQLDQFGLPRQAWADMYIGLSNAVYAEYVPELIEALRQTNTAWRKAAVDQQAYLGRAYAEERARTIAVTEHTLLNAMTELIVTMAFNDTMEQLAALEEPEGAI